MFLSTESKALLKSMKIMAAFFRWFLISSTIRLRARFCEDVDRRGLNPFWFGREIFSSSGRIQESIVDLCSSLCYTYSTIVFRNSQVAFLGYWFDTRNPPFRWSIP